MPPHLSLKPSLQLTFILSFIHVGALLCLLLSSTPVWLKIIGTCTCLFSAYFTLQKYALLTHPQAIVQCSPLAAGLWLLTNRQGKVQTAHLSGQSWRSRYMVILHFKLAKRRQHASVILLNDSLDPTILRRLQVYLTVFPIRG